MSDADLARALETPAGARVYTPEWLAKYDEEVVDNVCRHHWRCDPAEMVAAYDRNIGPRHLDVGPGTGYFLDRCRHATAEPEITLVDVNPDVLRQSLTRLYRFRPHVVRADVLSPFDLGSRVVDSAGLNLLLHCLPGDVAAKARVLDHVRAHVVDGGRIFGSTVLGLSATHTAPAVELLKQLNGMGAFDNLDDTLDALRDELAARFDDLRVVVHGSIALFEATA